MHTLNHSMVIFCEGNALLATVIGDLNRAVITTNAPDFMLES